MEATGLTRARAYRLLKGGTLPFKVFGGVRYVQGEDIAPLALAPRRNGRPTS